MKRLFLGSVAAAAVLAAAPTLAADLKPVYKAPPLAPPVFSWTGFYIGGHVGVVAGKVSNEGVTTAEDCFCLDPKGDLVQTLGGIHAGYNYQLNNLVLGVEGDINKRFGEGVFAATQLRTRSEWDASIRARAGYLVTPQTLLYATGGVAFGRFKTSNAIASTELESDLLGGSRTGWTVGGGLEYALDSAWSARIEYRYTDWGSKNVTWNFPSSDGEGDVDRSQRVSSRLTDSRVMVGMSYQFGGRLPSPVNSAFAADLPVKAPPIVAPYNWTGFYIGGHVGSSASQMRVATNTPILGDGDPFMDTVYGGFTQVLAGAHGGYNYQLNNVVIGLEGDINFKAGGGTLLSRVALPTSDWDGSIRARLGVLVTPRALVYGTGGFAFGHFTTPWHEVPNQFELGGNPNALNPEPLELLGGSRTGWTVGGGIEYALDNNWSTRIEYRYTDWGSKGVLWSPDEEVALVPSSSKLTETRVTTGLTYKFGPPGRLGERDVVPANWAGLYAGLQVGSSAGRIKYGGINPNDGEEDVEFAKFTQALVGGYVGYNYLVGQNFIVGAEGDLNAKLGSGYKIDDRLRPTSEWDGSIRARLGYAATARSLIYTTGGLAFGHFKTPQSGAQERQGGNSVGNLACPDQNFGPSGPGCPSEPAEDHVGGSRIGWTVGGGIEYAVNQNWSTRIDYRYTDYGKKTTTVNTGYTFDTYPSKLTENRISVGVAYHFGGDVVPLRAKN